MRRSGIGVRASLLGLLLCLAAAVTILITYQGHESRRLQVQQIREDALRLARGVGASHRQLLVGSHAILSMLARVPSIRAGDWPACWEYLAFMDKDPGFKPYTGFGVFNLEGELVCNSRPVPAPLNVADREWFQKARTTGAFTTGDYLIGRSSREAIVPLSHPVMNDSGQPAAIILGALRVEWFTDLMAQAHLPAGAYAAIIDRKGVLLAKHPANPGEIGSPLAVPWLSAVIDHAEGGDAFAGRHGKEQLVATMPLDGVAAMVLVVMDQHALLTSSRESFQRTLVLMAAIAGGALVFLWWGSAWVFKPLRGLALTARAIGAGTWRADECEANTLPLEFAELGQAFDDMAHRLASRERELKEYQVELETLLTSVGEGICGLDATGRCTFANPEALRLSGWTLAEILGRPVHPLWHHTRPDGSPYPLEDCPINHAARAGQGLTMQEDLFWRKDGMPYVVEYTVTSLPEGAGSVVVFRDISEKKHQEDRLRQSEERFRTLFDGVTDAILLHDLDGRFIEVNRAACARLGYSREEMREMRPQDIVASDEIALVSSRIQEIAEHGVLVFETIHVGRDGRHIPVEINARLIRYDGSSAILSAARDISDRKAQEERIRHLASHDPLTDLPNRKLFEDRLDFALRQAKRNSRQLAVLYIDLDHFKPINDTFGHAAGDLVLTEVARRLRLTIRDSDTVARVGGDEFLVLLTDIDGLSGAALVAEKVLAALTAPFTCQERGLDIGSSIGIALYPQNGASKEVLVCAADTAMYAAKNAGRNGVRFAGALSEV